jgi:uncharacterized protein (DUF4415 family)
MSERDIRRYSLDDLRRQKSETDWPRVGSGGDHEGPAEVDIDWSTARIVESESKTLISLRVDPDVLAFFKAQGKGYQTRINAVLRSYVEARKRGT